MYDQAIAEFSTAIKKKSAGCGCVFQPRNLYLDNDRLDEAVFDFNR